MIRFVRNTLQTTLFTAGLLLGTNAAFAQTPAPDAQAATQRQTLQAEITREGLKRFTAPGYKPGRVEHIVLFRYKDTVTDKQKAEVKKRFLALEQIAKRSGKRYITSIITGKQNSGEGVDHGFEQAFVVRFKSEGDRNYYVGAPIVEDAKYYDPKHAEFKTFVGPLLAEGQQGVLVFDFAADKH
ncbi:Dabb family protein [Pseudomonas sp. O64]|uniref:Dabb family protein n=1 Tax=Pseudomonas TaxID=286 RepID=UPI000B9FF386|nr:MULTISPECIES: Dabb family protein [unclassified Pseudomonas]MCV2230749.1 Dabb family protein [Pseudomonas sp. AU10]OZO03358.1 stress responsive alpha-beta barrel [Pseudomonas sp. IB20]UNM17938.1 Dabb family protein [Pseudomonas sp. ArH3a]UXZ20779.1 Dabb family protein [Pseudomonas sp. YeP6b]